MRLEETVVFEPPEVVMEGSPLKLLTPGLHRAGTSNDNDFEIEEFKNNDAMLDHYDESEDSKLARTEELPESPISVVAKPFSKTASNNTLFNSFGEEEELVFPKPINWDWPFCLEGVARGAFLEDKFFICLPFNNGGTGETSGSTKKFEKISECNYSWTIGLSNGGDFGTSFWRLELEIIRQLNMLVIIVSRDISIKNSHKKLKRVRKVYKLPDYYDIRTLKTKRYDWAVILEAQPRTRYRNGRPIRVLRRADSMI